MFCREGSAVKMLSQLHTCELSGLAQCVLSLISGLDRRETYARTRICILNQQMLILQRVKSVCKFVCKLRFTIFRVVTRHFQWRGGRIMQPQPTIFGPSLVKFVKKKKINTTKYFTFINKNQLGKPRKKKDFNPPPSSLMAVRKSQSEIK